MNLDICVMWRPIFFGRRRHALQCTTTEVNANH